MTTESGGEAERENDAIIARRNADNGIFDASAASRAEKARREEAEIKRINDALDAANALAMSEAEAAAALLAMEQEQEQIDDLLMMDEIAGGGGGLGGLLDLPPVSSPTSIFGINPIYLLGGLVGFVGYLAYVRR